MISATKIKNLRSKTGAGMMDCKEALLEVGGDLEGAIDWLRKKGINTAQKKSERSASEGLITVAKEEKFACIVEINSETDFVARNIDFQKFCSSVSETILKNKLEKINQLKDATLSGTGLSVSDSLTDLISKIGENILIKRLDYIKFDENLFVQKYIHNAVNNDSGKIGVLLAVKYNEFNENIELFTKNLAMHIAAMTPKAIDINDLDPSLIQREKNIYIEQEEKSNKPPEIKEKIIEGKLNKFFNEVCFLRQYFVMENKTNIKNYINSFEKENNCKIEIKKFLIFKVGEIS